MIQPVAQEDLRTKFAKVLLDRHFKEIRLDLEGELLKVRFTTNSVSFENFTLFEKIKNSVELSSNEKNLALPLVNKDLRFSAPKIAYFLMLHELLDPQALYSEECIDGRIHLTIKANSRPITLTLVC